MANFTRDIMINSLANMRYHKGRLFGALNDRLAGDFPALCELRTSYEQTELYLQQGMGELILRKHGLNHVRSVSDLTVGVHWLTDTKGSQPEPPELVVYTIIAGGLSQLRMTEELGDRERLPYEIWADSQRYTNWTQLLRD